MQPVGKAKAKTQNGSSLSATTACRYSSEIVFVNILMRSELSVCNTVMRPPIPNSYNNGREVANFPDADTVHTVRLYYVPAP